MSGATVARHIPRVIFGIHIGFIGVFMLFVQHNEPQIFHRCEHRAARAHHHIGQPLFHPAVGVKPFTGRQRRMHHCHPCAVSSRKDRKRLRRQGDFRKQNDNAPPLFQHFVNDPEHHRRFSASGHAVKQNAVPLTVIGKATNLLKNRRLLPVQFKILCRSGLGHRPVGVWVAEKHGFFFPEQPFSAKRLGHSYLKPCLAQGAVLFGFFPDKIKKRPLARAQPRQFSRDR